MTVIPSSARRSATSASNELSPVCCGAGSPAAEQPGTRAGHPVRVDVTAGERADQGQPLPGPGDGDVEPPLAAVAQERAPVIAHPAVAVLAVPDGQDDRVTLVALDAF